MTGSDVFDALRDEQEALEAMLDALDDAAWGSPSLCPGWSVAADRLQTSGDGANDVLELVRTYA